MKIALIAMSGLRAYDAELTRLGMTLPGFVERSRVIASLPSLSLLTLAGLTPERHEVSYHEVAVIRALGELPECDLAAVSTYTAQAKEAYELAGRYQAAGVPTVIGGLHATLIPEDALPHVDSIVAGEGELAWPRIIKDFERGRLERFYDYRGQEFDLSRAPMPRFDLLEPERYNRLTVQTQRGCPWRCEFCAASIRLTSRYKVKPVQKVMAEIREIKKIWPRPYIEFTDDNTFVNKGHSKALLRALAEEDVRWFTETDISVAEDEELLDLMRESGCAQVLIGLESPNAAGLEGLEQRRNWKLKRLGSYKEAIRRIQSHGIAVDGCFVLGLDGDTARTFDDVEEFVSESGLQQVQITVMTAFPGTPLYERLRAEGRLLEERAWEKTTLFDVNIQPKQMSVAELRRCFIELGLRLYANEAKAQRMASFRRHVREGRRGGRDSALD